MCSIFLAFTLVASLFIQTRRLEREPQTFDTIKVRPELRWFRQITATFLVIIFAWLYVMVMTFFTNTDLPLWYIIWIALSVMIYWLGHIGIYKFGIQEQRKKIRNYSIEHKAAYVPEKQPTNTSVHLKI